MVSCVSELQQFWLQSSFKDFVDVLDIDLWSHEEQFGWLILSFRCCGDWGGFSGWPLVVDQRVASNNLVEGIVSDDSVQCVVAQTACDVIGSTAGDGVSIV